MCAYWVCSFPRSGRQTAGRSESRALSSHKCLEIPRLLLLQLPLPLPLSVSLVWVYLGVKFKFKFDLKLELGCAFIDSLDARVMPVKWSLREGWRKLKLFAAILAMAKRELIEISYANASSRSTAQCASVCGCVWRNICVLDRELSRPAQPGFGSGSGSGSGQRATGSHMHHTLFAHFAFWPEFRKVCQQHFRCSSS